MNGAPKEYEEETHLSAAASWTILIVFTALIMSWGMFVKTIVATGPAQWDFGALPDTPSQSAYSTVPPPPDIKIPYQIQRIPDAQLPPGEIKQ
jgi:hypothetical protein